MYSPFRYIGFSLWKRRPIHLTLFLTRRCNSLCPFCFYLGEKAKPSGDTTELSLDEIKNISHRMGTLLWLAFSGGEIYLREDLAEISRVFYRNNRPSIMLLPTNGLLPETIKETTEDILKHCKESIIVVKLSLDGLNSAHDRLRGVLGGFEKLMRTYELLGSLLGAYKNFELGINTLFCSVNQHCMDEIIEFVGRMKMIKTHTITMVRGDIEDSYKDVDFGKYLSAIEKLEGNLKNKTSSIYRFRGARLKAAQDILQRRLIHKTLTEGKRKIPCYAGRLNLVLTETGGVYPCEVLRREMGNIRDFGYDIGALLKSPAAKNAVSFINENRCFCSHECYLMTDILFNPKTYPSLIREYLHLIP